MARYFDPKSYNIILVDQRGCGESTPFAELRENSTYDSVRDFEALRKHLNINKWQVFGGSWGSTLGLAYAVSQSALRTGNRTCVSLTRCCALRGFGCSNWHSFSGA